MRGNTEIIALRNIYNLVAVLILISTFTGCTAGSCLSYGHSCWGAHGKRSGLERGIADRRISPLNVGGRWLFSRMVNRQQAPLRFKSYVRMLPGISIPTEQRHSDLMDQFSEDINVRDTAIGESKIEERIIPPDVPLVPRRKFVNNDDDEAIKIGLYKILKNVDNKLK